MEYTNECLLGFLAAEINIAVNSWLRTETWYARMKVTPTGRATITIGWPEIIEEFRLVEGDIYARSASRMREMLKEETL